MKHIRLFGAGKSATVLIDYLLKHAEACKWQLMVTDADLALAKGKINNHPLGQAVSFDIRDERLRREFITGADIVVSMLPATLHNLVARDCLAAGKHLLNASYVDAELREMEEEIEAKGVLFLCEMGLDPGIDHMSAMQIIDRIRDDGGKITCFKSHCGGLVAPESDNNPWHYKISWNPRNIILAGKSGAHYRENGMDIHLSYPQLFNQRREVNVPGLGGLCWYPNRDSLSYESLYGLERVPTFVRTTLRHADFISGWSQVIQLGLTDETPIYESDGRSIANIFKEHIDRHGWTDWWKQRLAEGGVSMKQLAFLGFDDDETLVNRGRCSAADVLQFSAETRLALQPTDKDMIVMLHDFEYEDRGVVKKVRSSLVTIGDDSLRTAMAKTVGLPLGIATRLILDGTIQLRGLRIPTHREIYEPVLRELSEHGIVFHES